MIDCDETNNIMVGMNPAGSSNTMHALVRLILVSFGQNILSQVLFRSHDKYDEDIIFAVSVENTTWRNDNLSIWQV